MLSVAFFRGTAIINFRGSLLRKILQRVRLRDEEKRKVVPLYGDIAESSRPGWIGPYARASRAAGADASLPGQKSDSEKYEDRPGDAQKPFLE